MNEETQAFSLCCWYLLSLRETESDLLVFATVPTIRKRAIKYPTVHLFCKAVWCFVLNRIWFQDKMMKIEDNYFAAPWESNTLRSEWELRGKGREQRGRKSRVEGGKRGGLRSSDSQSRTADHTWHLSQPQFHLACRRLKTSLNKTFVSGYSPIQSGAVWQEVSRTRALFSSATCPDRGLTLAENQGGGKKKEKKTLFPSCSAISEINDSALS